MRTSFTPSSRRTDRIAPAALIELPRRPPPEENPITAAEYRRRSLAIRIALAVGVAAGAIGMVASTMDLTSGPAREGPGVALTTAPEAFVIAIAIGTVAAALAAATVRLWLHLIGLVGVTLVTFVAGATIVGARASAELEPRAAVAVEAGGLLMTVSFGLAAIALLAQLQALRMISRPGGEARAHGGRPDPGIAVKANAALGVGLLSLIVPLAASLAVALGTLANGDIRRSQNQLEGLGRSLAGIILGTFVLALVLVAGVIGVIVARPGE